ARRAVSCTSKTSEAILRTAARRSGFLSSLLRAGSSSTFTTASVYSRTWSVGAPAHARGLATATRPRATITTADARIMNATPPRRSIPCTPPPRARLPDDGLEVGEDFLLELIESLAERVAEVGVSILPSLERLEVGDHAIEAVALDQVVRHEKRELIGGQRAFLEMAHRETAGIAERFEVEPRGHQRGVVANARDGEHAAFGGGGGAEALGRGDCPVPGHALGEPLLRASLALRHLDLRYVRELVRDQAQPLAPARLPAVIVEQELATLADADRELRQLGRARRPDHPLPHEPLLEPLPPPA